MGAQSYAIAPTPSISRAQRQERTLCPLLCNSEQLGTSLERNQPHHTLVWQAEHMIICRQPPLLEQLCKRLPYVSVRATHANADVSRARQPYP